VEDAGVMEKREEGELPAGWVSTSVGSSAKIIRGVTYSNDKASPIPQKGLVPLLRATNFSDNGFDITDLTYVPEYLVSEDQHFKIGDIIVAMSSGSKRIVGKTAYNKVLDGFTIGAFCSIIRASAKVNLQYLSQYLRSDYYRKQISKLSSGSNINNLTAGAFSAVKIPLPPLPEQQRIAARLDLLLGKLKAARKKLDAMPELITRFRKSVLAEAVSGRLTQEWREGHPGQVDSSQLAGYLLQAHLDAGGHKIGNAAPPTESAHILEQKDFPGGWHLISLRDLVEPTRPITYGILKPGPDLKEGVPYIRVADFPGDVLRVESIRRTSKDIDESFKRSRLKKG
jgi:type I restriction enzyme, S subunit